MQVIVDRGRCEANARCMVEAPGVFLVDDDDELQVLDETPSEELRSQVEAAVRACPMMALALDG